MKTILASVSLVALVGCSSVEDRPDFFFSTSPSLHFTTIDRYSPCVSEKTIPLPDILKDFVAYGLDGETKPLALENPQRFLEDILAEAQELGYSEERLKTLSVRDSVRLACMIAASRLNYYGTSREDMLTKNIQALEQLHRDGGDDTALMNYLEKLKTYTTTTIEFDRLSAGLSTIEFDKVPVDVIFRNGEEIVCRHYARVTAGIFSVLKNLNSSLINTTLSCYDARGDHLWNQVTTVREDHNGIAFDVAFVDPTSLDIKPEWIEGLDEFHLGPDFGMLWLHVGDFYAGFDTPEATQQAFACYRRLADNENKWQGDPFWFEGGLAEARLLRQRGQPYHQQYLELAARLPDGDKRLVDLAERLEEYPREAIGLLERALSNAEIEGDVLETLATMYAHVGDGKRALEEVEKINDDVDTASFEHLFAYARVASVLEQHDFERALVLRKRCVEVGGRDYLPDFVNCLFHSGRKQETLDY